MESGALRKAIGNAQLKKLLATSHMYRLLSFCFLYPSEEMQQALRDGSLASQMKTISQTLPYASKIREEVVTFISSLTDNVSKVRPSSIQTEYDVLFGQSEELPCPPYETSYNTEQIFSTSRKLADIAGFYRAFGLSTSGTWHDRVDHVAAELEFMHFLTFKEAHAIASGKQSEAQLTKDASLKFLKEHVLEWVGSFAENLQKVSKVPYYASLGELTRKFIMLEGNCLGLNTKLDSKPRDTKPPEDAGCGVQCGL